MLVCAYKQNVNFPLENRLCLVALFNQISANMFQLMGTPTEEIEILRCTFPEGITFASPKM